MCSICEKSKSSEGNLQDLVNLTITRPSPSEQQSCLQATATTAQRTLTSTSVYAAVVSNEKQDTEAEILTIHCNTMQKLIGAAGQRIKEEFKCVARSRKLPQARLTRCNQTRPLCSYRRRRFLPRSSNANLLQERRQEEHSYPSYRPELVRRAGRSRRYGRKARQRSHPYPMARLFDARKQVSPRTPHPHCRKLYILAYILCAILNYSPPLTG